MTELLKEYYETKERFRTEEVRKRYQTTHEWSIALNNALAEILSRMNKEELEYLLEHTSGMFRSVISEYLRKFDNSDTQGKENLKSKSKRKRTKNSADNEIAATLVSIAIH